MFKSIRKAVKKYMDERVEVIKAKKEVVIDIMNEITQNKNNKDLIADILIGSGIGVIGVGIGIGVIGILMKMNI